MIMTAVMMMMLEEVIHYAIKAQKGRGGGTP
jgi:hypothetical protein